MDIATTLAEEFTEPAAPTAFEEITRQLIIVLEAAPWLSFSDTFFDAIFTHAV